MKLPRLMKSGWFLAILLVVIASGWKAILQAVAVVPFNADEAIVALMARHILGGERPVFFYGQSYMGSLDAFLVAAGFALFGQQVWVIRLIQGGLYAGTLTTTVLLGKELFGSTRKGLMAAALLTIPTVNVTLYTTASLGGYGEALLIGNLILYLAHAVAHKPGWLKALALGGLVGLGVWANGLTLVYSIPAGCYVVWGLWKNNGNPKRWWVLLAAALGGMAGSLPWWMYAAVHGFGGLVSELLGTAVAVEKVAWLERTGLHLVNLVLIGLPAAMGLRPPWSIEWLALPLLPIALLFWLWVAFKALRRVMKPNRLRSEYALLGGVSLVLGAGFVLTAFGVDPSGRYFLPLAVLFALMGVDAVSSPEASETPVHRKNGGLLTKIPWAGPVLLGMVVLFQGIGNVQCALEYPPGFTTQFDTTTIVDHRVDAELIAFLRTQGETRGYSDYWTAYPLAFESGEDLIFIPRLPYHQDLRYTARDDRYPPYDELVKTSQKTAYITTHNPALDLLIRGRLEKMGVTWKEKILGDYQVFYQLTQPVRPEDLGL